MVNEFSSNLSKLGLDIIDSNMLNKKKLFLQI